MNTQIAFVLLGGIIGYIGAIIQHFLESNRKRKSEIRVEKLRIYSQVVSELGSLFIEKETFTNDVLQKEYSFKFDLRLSKILAPVRLIASNKLAEKIRDLFEAESDWHSYLGNHSIDKNPETGRRLATAATKVRMEVEMEMRNELK